MKKLRCYALGIVATEALSHSCTSPMISGQSYKRFTIVIYDSRVVIWSIFKSNTTLES